MSSFTNTITYNDGDNFVHDAALVSFDASGVSLDLIDASATDFSEDFADDTGFTYDNTNAEFTSGLVRTKDQRPTGALFGATYTTNYNGNWGNGVLTGTGAGAFSVSGGLLNLCGAVSVRSVTYPAAGNAPLGQTGCLRFYINACYSGSPDASRYIFSLGNGVTSAFNLIELYHTSTGVIHCIIRDQAAGAIVDVDFGAWVPVSGSNYEFELNFDVTTGATRLFINGTQLGSTHTGTGTRNGSDLLYFRLGSDKNGTALTNFKFDNVVVFSTVQHTASYTAGYTLQDTIYLESKVTCPTYTYSGPGSILSIGTPTSTEVGSVRWIVDNQYWNGSAFVASNGTYAQASSKADWIANLSAFVLSGSDIVVECVFTSSNTLASVADMTFTVTGQEYVTTSPTVLPNATLDTDGIESFSAVESVSGNSSIKYQISVDGVYKYWTGSAWATASSVANANTAAEINTNCASLDLSAGAVVRVRAVLISDGATDAYLTSITIGYNFFTVAPGAPDTCLVWLFISDMLGDAVASGASIEFNLGQSVESGSRFILAGKESVTFDSRGYAEASLVVGSEYGFKISYTDLNGNAKTLTLLPATIPDQDDISLAALTDI